jgi:hypothetical protein
MAHMKYPRLSLFLSLALAWFLGGWQSASAQTLNLNNGIQSNLILNNTTANLSGQCELHLTATNNPMPGCTINLNSPTAWFFLDNIRPQTLISNYLGQITVNGAAAVVDSNVRVVEYAMGAVVIPQGPTYLPLQIFSGSQFTGSSMQLGLYTYYNSANLGSISNAVSSFILKRGYMASFAQQSDGSGISRVYVAQDGDIQVGALPSTLNHAVGFIRVFPWRWTSKKGWAGTPEPKVNPLWSYDWDNGATSTTNVEYVPMRHDLYWDSYANNNTKLDSTHVLGFNEPDNASQANMTVQQAIAQWPYMMASGLRLGSPAPTDGGLSWLYSFIAQADALNYRVDYVAVHFYQCGLSAQQLYNWLWAIHVQTHRPIWVTEFNNGATWTSCAVPTLAQNAQTIQDFITMMDNAPFVERYAIYNWVGDTRAMADTNDVLTPAGTNYLNEYSPNAFRQEFPAGVGADAYYHFESNALDSSGSGNDALLAGAPQFTSGKTGQAIQLDGVHDSVQIPVNVGTGSNFTFAAWVNWNGGTTWSRIFDFGFDTNVYAYLTPSSSSGTLRFAITTNGNTVEQALETTGLTAGTWTHVAVVINGTTAKLYVNGVPVVSSTGLTINPAMLQNKYNYLGKSRFPGDPLFAGQLDEVFIAGYALTDAQVAALPTATTPQFTSDPIAGAVAEVNQAYSGSIASYGTNVGGGTLTFSKVDGPAWLTVAANGTLTGTPAIADMGTGIFNVRVVNSTGVEAITRLTITVQSLTPQAANPGFEVPFTGDYIYNAQGGAWTFSQYAGAGSGVTANGSDFTSGNAVAPEGVQVAFLQATGTISQTISSFTPGVNYTLQFLASQRQNQTQAGNTFNVLIDNTVIASFAPTQTGTNYVQYTATFTATAVAHKLSFVGSDLNGGDNTVFLDNVQIIPAAPPVPPTSLSATDGTSIVNLTWVQSSSSGITQNKVYRSTSGSGGPYTLLATLSPTTSYADTAVANGSTYYYTVTAVNANGESPYSSYIGATPLASPSGLTAQALSSSKIKLTWAAGTGATSYNIKSASVSGGPYTTIATGMTATSYTNTALTAGTAYYYVVASANLAGTSANSSQASATTISPINIPNFGFETPVTTSYIYNPTGGSWTFNGAPPSGSGVSTNNSGFTVGNPLAPQGHQVAFLQETGYVSQALTGFVAGVTYTVSFAAAERVTYQNGGESWNLLLNTNVLASYAPAKTATNYTTYTASFTATTNNYTLKLLGTDLNGGDNTVFIDNVQITAP